MKIITKIVSFLFCVSLTTMAIGQTCNDGIQNGSETGIDCGGTCAPCATPCQIDLTFATSTYNPPIVPGPAYTMSSGTISTDGGTFYDPGGPSGSYGNNNLNTQTFCSSIPNGQIQFVFSQWALEMCCDYLTIYDGPTASGTVLFNGHGSSNPGTVTSTNGCLTFFWDSDGSVVGAGWTATIAIVNVQTPLDCTGGDIVLTAVGQGAAVLAIDNDFDFGSAGSGWSSNVTASFSNPCDPSIDGGTYMWMGSSAAHPRIIQTVPLDLSCGGEICFWLDFATQGAPSPCEGIDLANEGVFLEYSINGGTNWTTIEYFGPAGVGNSTSGGGSNAQMTSWNQYCYTIPAAAETPNTIIHWAQTGSSGLNNDHWGIDNVTISSVADCTPYWYDYSHIIGTDDGPVQSETLTGTTTYTVTYTNGSDACSTSITVPVAPCPCPDATVSGGGTFCTGDSIPDVVFSVVGGAYPITLTYAIDGVSQPAIVFSSASYTLFNPSDGQYTITSVTDTTLCVGTFSGSVDVVGNTPPVLVSFGGGDTYCNGDVVADIVVEATGSDPLTINFSIDGVVQTPATGTSPFSLGNIDGFYELISISDAGCTTPVTGEDSIIINPIPIATASTTTPIICEGSNIVLSGNTEPGTYSWTGPNSYSSSNEDPLITGAMVNQTGTYTLTITNNGCTSPPSTVDITVNAIPVVTTNANQTICIGTSVTLSGSGATTYSWDNGVANGVSFVPGTTQTYTVTGTTNGCTSTATVTITVLPLPIADGSASINSGYAPLPVTFINNSLNATSYVWEYGNGNTLPTNSLSNVNTTYNTPGTYYVVLTASNGLCSDTWTDSIVVISYPALEVYVPNVFSPNEDGSNDLYFIEVINGKSFEATIVNRWGNVVHTLDILNAGWDGQINGNPASDGVYFIQYVVEGLDGTTQEGHTYFHLIR